MSSIRRADRKLRRWERYLRRYRKFFGDETVRSQRAHYLAWEALARSHQAHCGRPNDHHCRRRRRP